jgi:excisionase family DNA binding protein
MDAKTQRWLNATDAAKYAGVPVAVLKKAIEARELKSHRLTTASSRRYIHTSELDQWMSRLLSGELN